MARESLTAEVVLSSWPWRTGSIVYDPVLGLDLSSWELTDLRDHPEWVTVDAQLLDPRANYDERGKGLLSHLEADQPLLTTMYQIRSPEAEEVCLELSEMPEEKISDFLSEWDLQIEDIQIDNLPRLLDTLLSWPIEKHHAFLADWWERFEIPHRDGESAFRSGAGPEGTVYGSFGDQGLSVWKREIEGLDIQDFCLWAALRVHYGWRLDFPEEPWPGLPVISEIDSLFS